MNDIWYRLSKSPFRSKWKLTQKDWNYIHQKGLDTIQEHAKDFVQKRLSKADIKNDGRQTPMKGHPVFIAQHACACCCRGCLEKWHHIPKERNLNTKEIEYIVSLLMLWIKKEYEHL